MGSGVFSKLLNRTLGSSPTAELDMSDSYNGFEGRNSCTLHRSINIDYLRSRDARSRYYNQVT